jgi:hypothetical protein
VWRKGGGRLTCAVREMPLLGWAVGPRRCRTAVVDRPAWAGIRHALPGHAGVWRCTLG